MRKNLVYPLLSIVLFASCACLNAQAPPVDEEAAVIAAAVTHMARTRTENPGGLRGAIGFDSRVVETRQVENPSGTPVMRYELTGSREDRVTASVLARVNASAGDFDTARVCATASLRSCSLRDHVALFASSNPVVIGDSAEVIIKALWTGTLAKYPVEQGDFLITLRRDGPAWEVVGKRGLNIVY